VLRLFAAAVRTGCIKQDKDIALNFQREEIVKNDFDTALGRTLTATFVQSIQRCDF
jgi:hypothetical protein